VCIQREQCVACLHIYLCVFYSRREHISVTTCTSVYLVQQEWTLAYDMVTFYLYMYVTIHWSTTWCFVLSPIRCLLCQKSRNVYSRSPTIGIFDKHLSPVDTCQVARTVCLIRFPPIVGKCDPAQGSHQCSVQPLSRDMGRHRQSVMHGSYPDRYGLSLGVYQLVYHEELRRVWYAEDYSYAAKAVTLMGPLCSELLLANSSVTSTRENPTSYE
jgi:hypothetical protein